MQNKLFLTIVAAILFSYLVIVLSIAFGIVFVGCVLLFIIIILIKSKGGDNAKNKRRKACCS